MTLRSAAAGLAAAPDLVTVLEHAGWLRSDADEERRLWDDGLAALADMDWFPGSHHRDVLAGLVDYVHERTR